MLLKNLSFSEGLVNGTRGTVLSFQNNPTSKIGCTVYVKFNVTIGNKKEEVDNKYNSFIY